MTEDPSYKAMIKKMEFAVFFRNRVEFAKYLIEENKIMLDFLKKMGMAKEK